MDEQAALVAGGDGAPFLQPGPEALDLVAVDVDPVWAGHGRLVSLRRARGLGAEIAGVFAKGVAGATPVGDDPSWHPWQPVEQRHRVGQFVGVSRRQHERCGAAVCVGEAPIG